MTGVRFIETMQAHPLDKQAMAAEMEPLRKIFGKSLVLRQSLQKGMILSRELLTAKKPGQGIPVADIDRVVGRRLVRSLPAAEFLQWQDLEEDKA